MNSRVDCVIAGAGVIGLAIARSLARRGMGVLVLERAGKIGTETSSRNSEVIHAGIYYPAHSLKNSLCIRGREQLYEYCRSRGVGCARLGKLIVATCQDDLGVLETYLETAAATGVRLQSLSAAEARKLEPAIRCREALLSPDSGIVDSHELMLSYVADIEAANGLIVCNSEVVSVEVVPRGVAISTSDSDAHDVVCTEFINSAGLYAQELARRIVGIDDSAIPEAHYAIGHYYSLSGRAPFKHLIYPIADQAGLGIHVTLDMAGRARFGPDVRWIDDIDYTFDDSRRGEFVTAIARYFPAIREREITPAYTGIRPKIVAAGEPFGDFVISGPESHGLRGITNLFGFESPGLSASLAIGERVAEGLS